MLLYNHIPAASVSVFSFNDTPQRGWWGVLLVVFHNQQRHYPVICVYATLLVKYFEYSQKKPMSKKTSKNSPKKVPRQEISKQAPDVRRHNFEEVALGYTEKEALLEASRCISCKNQPCVSNCPVMVDIPNFINKITEKDFEAAISIIKEKNTFPAVCGRVCPQEDQCEGKCTLGIKGEPVAIGRLERFVADLDLKKGGSSVLKKQKKTGKKIAVVGSGPSGLTLAGDLIKLGYDVSIFESLHKAGGVMVYGIPEFRLPKNIVQMEIDSLVRMGAEINTNFVIGRTKTIDELLEEGFEAVFIGAGAGLPFFLDMPGENLNGIYSANEFLTRVNLMKAYTFPEVDTPVVVRENVAVIGGGNVAMDSARTALRLGAKKVHIVYRRSREELPARYEEVENADEEGITFNLLSSPTEFIGDESGWVKKLVCQKMELGEKDERGRRQPIPIKGEFVELDVDVAIIAIGQGANPLITSTTKNLETNRWGYITVKDEFGLTSKERVYAGGDIVTGAATVILAMGAGKKAAGAIHDFLSSERK